MTEPSSQCRVCTDAHTSLFICEDCSHIYCTDHIDESAHHCGDSLFVSELPNGSRYVFPLRGIRRALIERVSSYNSSIGALASILFASPVTLGLIVIFVGWHLLQVSMLASMGFEQQGEWALSVGLHQEQLWDISTWFTSIISHGGAFHLAVNSLVLAMFGPFVERQLGSRRFLLFFIVSGIVAGLTQVGAASFMGIAMPPVLGASGGLAAGLGLLSTVEPDMEVYFLFVFPMALRTSITALIIVSFGIPLVYGVGAFGIAHIAHATGAVLGVAYGNLVLQNSSVGVFG